MRNVLGLHSVPAVLGLVLGAGAVGCESPDLKSGLKPEGDPEILQVFMRNRADGATEQAIAYGTHVDWEGTLGVDNAVAYGGQKIRVVLDELLRGDTLEMFVCACGATSGTTGADNPGACADGEPWYAREASGCTYDDPDTLADEAGHFLDLNLDGVPDSSLMIPDLVTVDCGGAALSWSNNENNGWWNPSGNQLVPMDRTLSAYWDGLGPAIAVQPAVLPTSSSCSILIDDSVVDLDANPVADMTVDDTGTEVPLVTFATEAMAVAETAPEDMETDVPVDSTITITFNVPVGDDSLTAITVEDDAGADVAGTWEIDGTDMIFTPTADLASDSVYTVTISTDVVDSFGIALPAGAAIAFETAAP